MFCNQCEKSIIDAQATSEDNLTKLLKEDKNFDIYYINCISKKMNLDFVKNYKKITIIEPFFGNVIERIIRKKRLPSKKMGWLRFR